MLSHGHGMYAPEWGARAHGLRARGRLVACGVRAGGHSCAALRSACCLRATCVRCVFCSGQARSDVLVPLLVLVLVLALCLCLYPGVVAGLVECADADARHVHHGFFWIPFTVNVVGPPWDSRSPQPTAVQCCSVLTRTHLNIVISILPLAVPEATVMDSDRHSWSPTPTDRDRRPPLHMKRCRYIWRFARARGADFWTIVTAGSRRPMVAPAQQSLRA
eukprot:scaffold7551_cov123-Isochrysis_galbana.AAC.7